MRPNKLTPGYNLIWESSRMMLPEHREQLLKERRKQEEFSFPILHDDQLEEINRLLIIAIEEERMVTITYGEKYGAAKFLGRIQKVDINEGVLKIGNGKDRLSLAFKRILQIELDTN